MPPDSEAQTVVEGAPRVRAPAVIECLPDGVLVIDAEGRVASVNAQAERLIGRSREAMLDRPLAEAAPLLWSEALREGLENAGRGCAAPELELDSAHIQGRLELRFSPCDGGVAIVMRDVTESRAAAEALRASEGQCRLITDTLPVLISYIDAEERYRYVNRTYQRWFGHDASRILGRHMREVLGEKAYQAIQDRVRRTLSGVPQSFEARLDYRDAGARDVAVRYVPHEADGRVLGFVALVEDITDRKRVEQALHQADERKSEFLATLAHELRNPLAPIRNAAQLIRLKSPPVPELQRAREMIDRQIDHLTRLVDDLLDVSRITHGKLELQRQTIALSSVIDYAAETCRPLIEARKHTLEVDVSDADVYVHGDPARLAQALANIVNNAAKFTPPGGRIGIAMRAEGSQAVIEVSDSGIGMESALVPHIFELFTQGNRSLDRAQGGLGIGLSLVKRLVELHAGSVEARSDGPGRGSEFRIRLPLAAAVDVPVARREHGSRPGPRRRVLIVDDNKDSADSLAALVSIDHHIVQTAYSGPAALGAARVFRPEIVFLDIGLPGMDGYEVARRLRQFPETRSARLVALTGYGQPRDRERSREAGFDHHAVKPLDPAALPELMS